MTSSIPPELVLKLSFMPFEWDVKSMLVEYCKTTGTTSGRSNRLHREAKIKDFNIKVTTKNFRRYSESFTNI
ncbi:hypothetical protein evm_013262 [Chilo suppressalis]|nr:hypothetical protein evm_013262 [Chilo suppressalis]